MPTKHTPVSPALERLRKARLAEVEERVIRLRRENAVGAGQLVLKTDVDRLLSLIATTLRSTLYSAIESELPPKLEGMTAAQQRPILRAAGDAICDTMGPLVNAFQWTGPGRLPDDETATKAKRSKRRQAAP